MICKLKKFVNHFTYNLVEYALLAADKANQSEEEPERVMDEYENRKITAVEALNKLDEVKNFIEVYGSNHLNMIFNELIENVKQISSKI